MWVFHYPGINAGVINCFHGRALAHINKLVIIKKMKIGLTYTGLEEKHNNYLQWLKGNDDIELVTLSKDNGNDEIIKNLDGMVMSGGVDLHPKYYNGNTGYTNAPEHFDEDRDAFETNVFHSSQQNNIPLLGVCRGMQLVNCILGGNLIQDIGSDANKIHCFQQNDKAHGVNIEAETLLNEIAALQRGVVNSAHHQAVNVTGKGLQANCISDDGITEGLEWADKSNRSFLLCIQWHPERMYKMGLQNAALSKNIRDRFIEEIKKSIQAKNENY